jgi:hypothetical protein
MKTVDSSLLENIAGCACNLIASHPSLLSFSEDLSTEDLVRLASIVQSEPGVGKPVRPPTHFVLEVKRAISQKAWRQLNTLLEKWEDRTKSQDRNRWSVKEHEYLSMGLLWQTLLITECKRRHDEIRQEIAAVRKT